MTRWLIGIDEAGRGSLAGPVAVGAVAVPLDFDWAQVAGARDSKQMTPKSREALYGKLLSLREKGVLSFAVALSSSSMIDTYGIVPSIKSALDRALTKVTEKVIVTRSKDSPPVVFQGLPLDKVEVRLDGGLRAPERFSNQITIVRGDVSEPVISLASIAAKVERDRLMCRLATKHPGYGLEVHKGYGTLAHRRAIQERGLAEIHRRTFCRALILRK